MGYIALLIVGLVFLYLVRSILPPFVIALTLVLLLDPLVDRIQTKRMPRIAAVLIVFLGFAIVFIGAAMWLVPKVISQVSDFAANLPDYFKQGGEFLSALMARHKALLERFNAPTTMSGAMARFSGQLQDYGKNAVNILGAVLTQVLEKSVWLILTVLLTFLLLKDIDKIRNKLMYLLPDSQKERTASIVREVGAVFARYLRGLIMVCALYGVAAFLLFTLFGLRYALVLALAAGLLYAVPYVGPIATALAALLVALAQHSDHPYIAVIVMLSTVVLNQVFDMILTPRVLGGAVGLHPVLAIFSLMAGGTLYGIPGMVIAVPIAASIQVILCQFFPKLGEPLERFRVGAKAKTPRPRRRKKT
jgi:predicted PurR-regulated permease PerM